MVCQSWILGGFGDLWEHLEGITSQLSYFPGCLMCGWSGLGGHEGFPLPCSWGVQGSQTHCCDADPFPSNFIACLTLACFSCLSKAKFGACFLQKWCGCVCHISPNQTKNCINLPVRCFWTHPWELFHLRLSQCSLGQQFWSFLKWWAHDLKTSCYIYMILNQQIVSLQDILGSRFYFLSL